MIFILPVIMNNDILIQYKKYRARNARFILILIILLALIGLIALMAGSHTISWHELWALIKGEGVEINRQILLNIRLPRILATIITGIILFFILGSEFFINYRLVWRGHHDGKEGK